ncbi:MAG: 2-oxo acid dehydrogenase subunit E2 [Spirochaetaceae bacterium]|nr:2-oxo acid dehydrogenase subunit E2 [Spirochaetaceae bacterium]
MKKVKHEIFHYPLSRLGTHDVGKIALTKHHITGLLEVDITELIRHVRKLRTEGKEISFFAWMVKEISDTISENLHIHALKGRRNSTVVFEDIDLSVMVEKLVNGKRVPLPLLIKKTNEKTAEEINAEIKKAQNQTIKDESDYVMGEKQISRLAMLLYYILPQRIRLFIMKQIMKNPYRSKEMMGTAIITTVGTAGHISGWILPKSIHNLCFALGPIAKKPWVVSDKIEIRDILHLTVLVDHDLVDGVPATQFISRFLNRLQKRV